MPRILRGIDGFNFRQGKYLSVRDVLLVLNTCREDSVEVGKEMHIPPPWLSS